MSIHLQPSREFVQWIRGTHRSDDSKPPLVAAAEPASDTITSILVETVGTCFIPEESNAIAPGVSTICYAGAFSEPGDSVTLPDGATFMLESYAAAPYLAGTPTALVTFTPEDYEAFLADADAAHEDGLFDPALLNPVALLADLPGLGLSTAATHQIAKYYIDATGQLRYGPAGAVINSKDDLDALDPADLVASAASRNDARVSTRSRPWIGRYLQALCMIAAFPQERSRVQVDGFGWSLSSDIPASTNPELPLVCVIDGQHVVWVPQHNRAFRVGRDAAVIVGHCASVFNGYDVPPLHRILGVSRNEAEEARTHIAQRFFAA